MGRPLPMEPYARPRDVDTNPSMASVLASPRAKAVALQGGYRNDMTLPLAIHHPSMASFQLHCICSIAGQPPGRVLSHLGTTDGLSAPASDPLYPPM